MAKCILYPDRGECTGCGDCRCELDPEKVCDNCMACERGEGDYRGILIDGIVMDEDEEAE